MKHNMGRADRIIRILVAALFIDLFFSHFVTRWLGIVFLVVAVVFVLTSLVGSCPLYGICGIKTIRSKRRPIE